MPSELDFSRRAQLSERMDEACSYEQFRSCLRDLARVNRMTLAYRPTLSWLRRLVAQGRSRGEFDRSSPLRIVDIGSGQGDMLRVISRWARKQELAVELTGIDLNPYAARAAREQSSAEESIQWLTGDAFSYAPATGVDVVISSLLTHHLSDAGIVRLLAWMEQNARRGWFVNDLHRAALPFYAFKLMSRLAGLDVFVQHDGPVSIRRSFQRADWEQYLAEAAIPSAAASIESFRPARLCVGRIREIGA